MIGRAKAQTLTMDEPRNAAAFFIEVRKTNAYGQPAANLLMKHWKSAALITESTVQFA